MKVGLIDVEKEEAIKEIRDVLISSHSVSCDKELYKPELYFEKEIYRLAPPIWSAYHSVTVDYNKLAAAVYEAGFRKVDTGGENNE